MKENFNLIRSILLFLQTYSKTRFGSGVIGFLICLGAVYWGIVKNQQETIEVLKLDNAEANRNLKICNQNLVTIREETREDAREEYRVLFEYVSNMTNKMRSEVNTEKAKVEQNIEELKREIKQKSKGI